VIPSRSLACVLVVVAASAEAWVSCNTIAGNHSATFAPPSDASVPTEGAADGAGLQDSHQDASTDASLDGNSGCAGNLTCDPLNCGAIGHDCLGGECVNGLCPAIVLANSQPSTDGIAVDDQYIFWTNSGTSQLNYTDGSVHRANKADGSSPMAIAVGQASPNAIILDTTNVYWCNYDTGDILTAAKDGTGLRTLATGILNVSGIVLDPPRMYLGLVINASTDGGIGFIPEDGGGYAPLTTGQYNPQNILFDAPSQHLFWSNYGSYVDGTGGSIVSLPVTGGTPERLAGAMGTTELAYDGVSLYWNNSLPPDGGSIGTLVADGGTATSLVSGLAGPGAVAVDAVHVYYADSGTIWRVLKDGTERISLATNQVEPGFMVTDETYVYWADVGSTHNQDGEVVKVAK
jgi:hypothetical protein